MSLNVRSDEGNKNTKKANKITAGNVKHPGRRKAELILGNSFVGHLTLLWKSGPASVQPARLNNRIRERGEITKGKQFPV